MELKPVRTGEETLAPYEAAQVAVSPDSQRVLRNTYLLLAITLVPPALGAAIGYTLDFSFMRSSPVLSSIAVLGIFYLWIFGIEKNRNSGLGVGLLLGFTLFMGLLLGPLLQSVLGLRNGIQLVMMAFGGTAAVFAVMAGIATTTKRDLSRMGNFLAVGAVVIMLAVVANVFFQSMTAYLVILAGFVLLSSPLMVWQINAILPRGADHHVSANPTPYVSVSKPCFHPPPI